MAKFEVRKYPVVLDGANTARIKMPEGATILAFRSRLGEPVIYAKIDPKAKKAVRIFRIITCCIPMNEDPDLVYIGTVEWAAEGWHVFEKVEAPAP